MLAVTFLIVAIAFHIMFVLIAFGTLFAYPVVTPYIARAYPRSVPALHALWLRASQRVIAPGAGILLLIGFYLASKEKVWDEVWVIVPVLILLGLLGGGGSFHTPAERKLVALAQRDVDAAGPDGPVTFSAEYTALAAKARLFMTGGAVAVLVAVYFMTTKPFA